MNLCLAMLKVLLTGGSAWFYLLPLWNLAEEHLRTPTAWMTPIVVRSSLVRKCSGGWSRMLRDYFRVQLLGANSIQVAGCPVVIGDMSLHIHAKLKVLMSDGDGIRMGFDWRGQSGLKPCFKHLIVW